MITKRTAEKAALLLFILFMVSCSGTPPRIVMLNWSRLVEISGNSIVSEGISFFINVEDEDGKGDIESVYLVNDTFELFWKLTPETWSEKTVDSQLWIGSNGIRMPGGDRMPAGTYRIIVIDKGGERDQREIFLTSFTLPEKLPEIDVFGGVIRIQSPFEENYLWLKDADGYTVKILKIVPGDTAEDLALRGVNEKVVSYVLYAFDSTSNCGYTVSVPSE